MKKILFLAIMVLAAASCNDKKNADGSKEGDSSDTINISEKDTAAIEVDADKPIKKVYEIEGVPEGQKMFYVNLYSIL